MPEADSNMVRDELHVLLDHIPDTGIATARKFLRALVDPVELSLLNALPDDEPESDEERAAVEAARAEQTQEPPMRKSCGNSAC